MTTVQSRKHILVPGFFGLCALVLVVLMLLGGWIDLPLDQVLFHPDAFWALFLYAYGPAPLYWAFLVSSFLMAQQARQSHGWRSWLYMLAGLVLLVGSVYSPTHAACKILGWSWLAGYGITLLLCLLPAILLYLPLMDLPDPQRQQILWYLLFVCVGSYAACLLLKELWMRPRFLALQREPAIPFLQWWQNGQTTKASFLEIYQENTDLFKSFPSAHSLSAAASFVWIIYPLYCKKAAHWLPWILAGAALYTAIVMLSRMVLGYHFLSDTAAGVLLFWLFFAAGYLYLIRYRASSNKTGSLRQEKNQ